MSERLEQYRMVLIALLSIMLLMSTAGRSPAQTQPPPQPPRMTRPPAAPAQPPTVQPAAVQPVQPRPQTAPGKQTGIDVIDYKIDAEMIPASNTLKATAAVTFQTLDAARSAVFE